MLAQADGTAGAVDHARAALELGAFQAHAAGAAARRDAGMSSTRYRLGHFRALKRSLTRDPSILYPIYRYFMCNKHVTSA